ncbi:hypothetical protein FRC02_000337 [Tulasnella sp. 418]|nr:hypothetical protein FRC02_000337 [Tulasnella sp. 418]
MTTTLTQAWLRQVVTPYNNKDRLYGDVDNILAIYPTLRPKTDVYTFDDGREHLLLCLHGLLPISYRSATYNIPIALWFPLNYPKEPPLTYVVPTGDMLIKASRDLDISGRCQFQYLRDWERKSEAATLRGLLEIMQDTFSKDSPVYAKPRNTHPSGSSASTPSIGTPSPPQPNYPSRNPAAAGSQLHSTGPPPLPVKPGMHGPLSPQSEAFSPLPSMSPIALTSRPPPPLPGQPEIAQPDPAQSVQPHVPQRPPPPPWVHPLSAPRLLPSDPSHPTGQSPVTSNLPPHHNRVLSSTSLPPSPPNHIQSPYGAQSSSAPPAPPAPPRPPQTQQWPPYISVPTSPTFQNPVPQAIPPPIANVQSPHIPVKYAGSPPPPPQNLTFPATSPPAPKPVHRPNFMDSEDDFGAAETSSPSDSGASLSTIVPARPPNPELLQLHAKLHQKFTTELASLAQTLSSDSERLRSTQTDLLNGEPAIRDEMARLVAVRDVCKSVAGRMKVLVEAADSNVNELRRKGDPEVDELICSTTIVYNQLIDLVAEDNAIEDTMYHLHRALNAGRIDLDRYLRVTRVLAEEQFMKRALIEKITSGIPIGAAMSHSYSF